MPKEAKASTTKAKSEARKAGVGDRPEGGKHRPKENDSKNDGRARRR